MKDVVVTTISALTPPLWTSAFVAGGLRADIEPELSSRVCYVGNQPEENIMPVILLWGIPALIVIGGGGYWLLHVH